MNALHRARFASLFRGRTDAFGTEHGGAQRFADGEHEQVYRRHLEGPEPCGVYPVVNNECVWGCVDFDIESPHHKSFDYHSEEEAHEAATTLARVLDALGIISWMERTRGRGRHTWVFTDVWVPAKEMRRALLAACEIAEVSSREVNPKSETLSEDQLGNYVRLPYPYGATDTRTMRGHTAEQWIDSAYARRNSAAVISKAAALWRPPPTPDIQSVPYDGDARLNRAGRAVVEAGPADGDRSRGMVYVAYQCMLSGLTPDQAVSILHGMHWNKFAGRADEERRLREIVEAGYR